MTTPITTLAEAKQALDLKARELHSSTRLTRSELLEALEVVFAIRLSPEDRQALLIHLEEVRKAEGANRAFTLRKSNQFLLPLRYLFAGLNDRTNTSRYAGALQELLDLEVRPEDFRQELKAKGGLVELYWRSRERTTKVLRRNKLSLDRNIEVRAGEEVTLRLLPTPGGVFKVLECRQERTS